MLLGAFLLPSLSSQAKGKRKVQEPCLSQGSTLLKEVFSAREQAVEGFGVFSLLETKIQLAPFLLVNAVWGHCLGIYPELQVRARTTEDNTEG